MSSETLVGGPLVSGGWSLCRTQGGEVVLVDGALEGEVVRVAPLEGRRPRRAAVVEVLEPSPARVAPTCPHVADGCGGCDFAHVRSAAQPEAKAYAVRDALARIGGLSDVVVETGEPLAGRDYRTTVRAVVVDGRAALRRRRSHDAVVLDRCEVAHPLVEEILVDGRFDGADEVVVRVGAATGERLVLASPTATGVRVPDGVRLVGADRLRAGDAASYREQVGGHTFVVSARSFFQSSHQGAEALGREVVSAAGDELAAARRVLDACCGVGLLGALAVRAAASAGGRPHLIGVEQVRGSVEDARVNLAPEAFPPDEGPTTTRVLRSALARLRERADLVLADPSRAGLGRDGVAALAATGASVLVLVSCDAGSLGRDAGLLVDAGFRIERARLVDLFPQTTHVEVVSRFVR